MMMYGLTGPSVLHNQLIVCCPLHGRVDKEDEMTCLIKGCNFVLKNIPHEAFVYARHADSEFRFQTTNPDIFPYLLVNIGSGVSIVKVAAVYFRGFRGGVEDNLPEL